MLLWKESGAINHSPHHHTWPHYSRRDPASMWVTAWPGWYHTTMPQPTQGPWPPPARAPARARGAKPPIWEVILQPLRVTGTCPFTPGRGTRLAALQSTHQGRRPPAAWGAVAHPQLPHVHYPALSKWPVLAGAHGSSRCGVWLSVPSWPHPRQPGPAWPGPVCSCGGGGGCCTRGGHSTPPPAVGFGS